MKLTKTHWTLLAINIIMLIIFGILFAARKNYEFLAYIGVIVFFLIIIGLSLTKVTYSNLTLWGLTLWAFLHMAGGGLSWNGHRWYEIMFFTVTEAYPILRYDQVIHALGFFVATLVVWELLKPHLTQGRTGWIALGIVVIMAGLGLGALNEIVEFVASELIEGTGVGGYINTSLDLVFDLLGAVIAWIVIWWREKNRF